MARLELDHSFSPQPASRRSVVSAEHAMERCARGDHTALADLFDAIAPPLAAHLMRKIPPQRVDRIVRTVMLELHHARASYVVGSAVLPWAIAIARRLLGPQPVQQMVDLEPRREGSTATMRLHAELAHVAEPMRTAWELVCLDRLSPAQAGQVLGVGRTRVRDHVQAAASQLGAVLQELDGTLDDGTTPCHASNDAANALRGHIALDRYRVERLIGSGAHGDVYVAADLQLDRSVALKVLRNEGSDRPARQRRFAREVELLRRVDDPGVAPAFDVGRLADGRDCYAMEYLHGQSLAELLIQRRRFPWSKVSAMVRPICETLAVVHGRGIVHRDLKPGNCFVERDAAGRERMRLLDFGVAKLVEQASGEALTSPGVLVGTPEYMAPEQLRGESVDARTDVYALGVTMYELLVGRPPFVGESLVSVITQHLFAPPQRPSEALGDPALVDADRIMLRALAKDPAERYASTTELASALGGVETRAPWHTEVQSRAVA